MLINQRAQKKFSLLTPVVALIAGIILARPFYHALLAQTWLNHDTVFYSTIILVFVFLGTIYTCNQYTKKRQLFLYSALWCMLGVLQFFLQQESKYALGKKIFGQHLTLHGTIIERNDNPTTGKSVLLTQIHEITQTQEKKHRASFFLLIYADNPPCSNGDQICLSNTILRPCQEKELRSPCSFNDYLTRNDCLTSYFISPFDRIMLMHTPPATWRTWLTRKRHQLMEHIKEQSSAPVAHFIQLIFFGNKYVTTPDTVKISFLTWGISHYLARSGLHIAFLIIIWSSILCIIPVHIRFKRLFLLAISLLYHFFSWPSISFIRSLALFCGGLLGKLTDQLPQTEHLLLLICLLSLLYNPIQLFFLDFQLTFLLTFCLIISR